MVDEVALGAELRDRLGVTTRDRLRAMGLSDRQIDGLVARGRLDRMGNGVFASAGVPDTFGRRVAVACGLTGGVASFPTAGRLWSFRKTPHDTDVHITVPWHRRIVARPGIVVHRSTLLPDSDIVRRRDGISLTSPPRTLFDAAGRVSPEALESMIEQGIDRRMFTIPTLWSVCRRMNRSARAGGTEFAAVLDARSTWRKPSRSDYELRLERALRARGFPELTREHAITIAAGVVVHPDLGLPDDGFFVEVDHLSWHGGRIESAYDRRRDVKVRLAGFHVERVTDIAIDHHLAETVEDLWALWQRHRGATSTVDVSRAPR